MTTAVELRAGDVTGTNFHIEGVAMNTHTGPMNDDYLRDLRRRTHARQATARIELGPRWLLHPDNAMQRKGGQQ